MAAKIGSTNSLKPLRPIFSSSRAEEGKADAVAAAGVVLVNKNHSLDQHHFLKAARYRACAPRPSARAKVASQLFLCRAATPPRLRRGAAVRTLGNGPVSPGSASVMRSSPERAVYQCYVALSGLGLIAHVNPG